MRIAYEKRLPDVEACQADNIQVSSYAGYKWPTYQREVHIHETDKDGVLHFSNYFKIAEEAMFIGLRKIGFPFENSPYSVAMLNAVTTYIEPIEFGDRIDIALVNFSMQRVKFILVFEFQNQNGISVSQTKLTLVTILIKDRKAIPVPSLLKTALEKVIADPDPMSYHTTAKKRIRKGNS